MTTLKLDELLRNEVLRRHEFPVCEDKIFLAHAGVSPLPRRATEAMQRYAEAAARDDQEDVLPDRVVTETRQLAAQLLEAEAAEIAFTSSTSMGLAMVAAGLDWRRGDSVVCYRDDYPANVYPWMDLAAKGVDVRYVEPREYGNVTVEDLDRVIDKSTKLVSLASVHFVSGWRLDIDGVGKFLRERGILFCLDAIQSLGGLRTSMRNVDFAAADAHKWLLGPLGIAILYVRKEHFDRLHPPLVGWHSASCPNYIAQDELKFWPDARRYEPGSLNLIGIVGARESLQLLVGLGIESVEKRVLATAQRVIDAARRSGLTVAGATTGGGVSGGVSLLSEERDVERLHAQLSSQNIITSLRQRRDGAKCLRISAHCYNSDAEIERLLEEFLSFKRA